MNLALQGSLAPGPYSAEFCGGDDGPHGYGGGQMQTTTGCISIKVSLYFPCINSGRGLEAQPEIGLSEIQEKFGSNNSAGRPQQLPKTSRSGGVQRLSRPSPGVRRQCQDRQTNPGSYRAPALARSPRRAVSSTARSGMV